MGPGCRPHFSNTSSNSSAHSCLRTSNLARAWSLVILPASNASLMARIFVAHSALTSGDLLHALLDARGLGPCGWGPGPWRFAVWVGAPGVRAGSLHAAVALVALAVARGWTAEEEEHEQDDRPDLPACGRGRGTGKGARENLVGNLRFFFNLASSSSKFAADEAASGATRGWCARASPAVSRGKRAKRPNRKIRASNRASDVPLWTPWGQTSTGWPSSTCGCSGRSPAPARGPRAPAEPRAWSRARTPRRHGRVALRRGHGLGRSGV